MSAPPGGHPLLLLASKAGRVGPLAYLRRRGWDDGVLGGRPVWLVAGGFAWTVWLVQWAWRREPELMYRTRLKPGESLVVNVRKPE